MYPTGRQLADLARQRQHDLLSEAAEVHRIRLARLSQSVPSPAASPLRRRLAVGLRALAAWLDDRSQVQTPLIRPAGAA